jgi:hypothetical protein
MSSTRSTPVEMIANGDELFAEEEHALLLVRLRAVAFLLSAGLTLVLVREELFGGGPGWPLQAAALVAMMFLATLLRPDLRSLRRLSPDSMSPRGWHQANGRARRRGLGLRRRVVRLRHVG